LNGCRPAREAAVLYSLSDPFGKRGVMGPTKFCGGGFGALGGWPVIVQNRGIGRLWTCRRAGKKGGSARVPCRFRSPRRPTYCGAARTPSEVLPRGSRAYPRDAGGLAGDSLPGLELAGIAVYIELYVELGGGLAPRGGGRWRTYVSIVATFGMVPRIRGAVGLVFNRGGKS